MDGDIFGAVTRLGRNAAEGIVLALDGGAWDPFLASRCIEVVIEKAGGVASLPAVVTILRSIQSTPLLAPVLVEGALDQIDDAVRQAKGTVLDLMLRDAARQIVLRGQYDVRAVMRLFCLKVLDRSIISARGGFVELTQNGLQCVEALALLTPVAAQAAQVLEERPDAKRLGLSRQYAQLSADTDLLGGH